MFNLHSPNGWVVVGAVFDAAVGRTYSCEDVGERGAGFAFIWNHDPNEPSDVVFGGTDWTENCTITLTAFGPNKGDRVAGDVTAELARSRGEGLIRNFSITAGHFELIQAFDTPTD